ncbi:MAG: SemiSWEET transporter [Deferribacteres bacterium]|nr:SemiSWEET transporter [candidate division KSB1 bacterium]MCB9503813.1 SemiSWEET transporter [Deferribacteres bacterium]
MITAIGLFAALCTTTAFLPQAIKTIRTKQTRDLSLRMYILQATGNFSWFIYGFITFNIPIMLADSITSILVVTILVMKLKYD